MTILKFPDCRVALAEIPEDGGSRREREREITGRLLEMAASRPANILHRPDGAPYPDWLPFHISISHSRRIAALLWSDSPGYGIDVEENRPGQLERVAPRVMSGDEIRHYSARPDGLLRAWTLKEAAFKAAGMADVADLREILLPLDDRDGLISLRGKPLRIIFSEKTETPFPVFLSIVKAENS